MLFGHVLVPTRTIRATTMRLLLFQFAMGFVATLWVDVSGVLFASNADVFLVYVEQDASRPSSCQDAIVPRNVASHPWGSGRWTFVLFFYLNLWGSGRWTFMRGLGSNIIVVLFKPAVCIGHPSTLTAVIRLV